VERILDITAVVVVVIVGVVLVVLVVVVIVLVVVVVGVVVVEVVVVVVGKRLSLMVEDVVMCWDRKVISPGREATCTSP